MNDKQIYSQILLIFEKILRTITDRYVIHDLPIPAEVLALKDEACRVTAKAAEEKKSKALIGYERRLREILNRL